MTRAPRHALLVALSVLLALAFAALPASAQADAYWYDEGVKVEEGAPISGVPEFAVTGVLGGSIAVTVSCALEYEGLVSNDPIAGFALIENVEFEDCSAEFSVSGYEDCGVIEEADEVPWTAVAVAHEASFEIELTGIKTMMEFGSEEWWECPIDGAKFIIEGSLVGQWEDGNPSVVNFEEVSGLTLYNYTGMPVGPLSVTSAFSVSGAGESVITLKGS